MFKHLYNELCMLEQTIILNKYIKKDLEILDKLEYDMKLELKKLSDKLDKDINDKVYRLKDLCFERYSNEENEK